MNAVVFLGPTLPAAEAREILDAVYLPPARQADLLSAVTRLQPDVVVLIDGVFFQAMSVWHKEILFALRRGVRVFGASSMGALRAAELAPYGMVGVGEVYEMYARGELTDDGDVALAHADAEDGYRALSEPLVNVLATLRGPAARTLLDDSDLNALEVAARSIYFPDRTVKRLVSEAVRRGMPSERGAEVTELFTDHYVDVKHEDAVAALRAAAAAPTSEPTPSASAALDASFLFIAARDRDRVIDHAGVQFPIGDVAAHAALHAPEFGQINFDGLNRAVVQAFAEVIGLEVGEDAVEEELRRFRRRMDLGDNDEVNDWSKRNDLDQDELRSLMRELATCRVLHRWLLFNQAVPGTSRVALDEARLKGRYREWAAGAAEDARLIRARHLLGNEPGRLGALTMSQLVEDHLARTSCSMDAEFTRWSFEAGFGNSAAFHTALLRAALARYAADRVRALFEPQQVSVEAAPDCDG